MSTAERDYWEGVLRMPWEVGHNVMPLLAFPEEKQAELNALAEAPTPPPRWKRYELCELPSRAYWEWHARRGKYPRERNGSGRESIPQWMRETIIERDRGVCQICAEQLVAQDALHIDHIYPVALGGKTTLENLQLAHGVCNMRKGARV